jgi:hypothetical protein
MGWTTDGSGWLPSTLSKRILSGQGPRSPRAEIAIVPIAVSTADRQKGLA